MVGIYKEFNLRLGPQPPQWPDEDEIVMKNR